MANQNLLLLFISIDIILVKVMFVKSYFVFMDFKMFVNYVRNFCLEVELMYRTDIFHLTVFMACCLCFI